MVRRAVSRMGGALPAGAALALAMSLCGRQASGDEPASAGAASVVALDVQVEAPAGCVTVDTFRGALAAHGVPMVPMAASPATTSPAVRVHVEITSFGALGTIHLERALERGAGEPRTDVVERQVRGANCADVEDALALVAALALEEEPAVEPPLASPPTPAPDVDADAPDELPPPAPAPRRLRLGAQGALLGLDAPAARPGFAVFGELLGELGGARQSVRASFGYAGASVAVASSALELAWATARLDVCPFDIALGAGFELNPCLAWETGVLHESARNALDAPSSTRPWLGPGGVVRVAFRLAPFLRLELQGAAIVPLERDEYVFAPGPVLGYRPPPVVPSGAGGLGFDFL